MKIDDYVNETTIQDTNNLFAKKEWKNIGGKRKWVRKCPKCNKEICYCEKYLKVKSEKNKVVCKSCALTKHYPPFVKVCDGCGRKTIYTKYKSFVWSVKNNGKCRHCGGNQAIQTRFNKGNLFGARYQSKTSRNKMSLMHTKENNPFYGKRHSIKNKKLFSKHSSSIERTDVWKKNIAKSLRIYKSGLYGRCNYSKKACQYFDELEKLHKWNGHYATKNGEKKIDSLGYWVDYYEPNLNLVIEYDEPYHYDINGNLKQKDINRMNEIKELLKCRFLRYNQKSGKLIEW